MLVIRAEERKLSINKVTCIPNINTPKAFCFYLVELDFMAFTLQYIVHPDIKLTLILTKKISLKRS